MQKFKIAVLLVLIILTNVAVTGCFGDEPAKKPKMELTLIGTSHKIFAGDSTTYVILVKNNRDENDTITLSLTGTPSGWEVILNQTSVFLTAGASLGIFVLVKSSESAKNGDHKVKVQAVSDDFGNKKTRSITTKVVSDSGNRVGMGDKVDVDYLGYLETYSIFDTNFDDIANNRNIRKEPAFQPMGSYKDLQVYVGSEDPDDKDPYNIMVDGFWEALLGMKEGQSRTVIIPPVKGYANFENATVNITEDITIFETLTVAEFTTTYPDEELIEGVTMQHSNWMWNMSIHYVNETENIVRIKNEPYLHQMISPYGWNSEVTYKNQSDNDGEGKIVITHHAQSEMEAVYQDFPAEVVSVEGDHINIIFNNSPHDFANLILSFDITLNNIQG
jgi:FKBP-type peptidyl-prolyl cis-trans isomerase 2